MDGAIAAGRIHLSYFRKQLAIEKKGPIDLVTAADKAAEREFRELVATRFPDHGVLGEEEAEAVAPNSPYRWIVDPLDGTTNFAHGLALFCVSIALEVDGELEVGVVYDPVADELFTAERGQGARLNGHLIRASVEPTLLNSLLCTGFPYTVRVDRSDQLAVFGAFLGEARAVRRLGSAALDLCYVAAGRFDGFWEDRLHAWDIAAGALIVEEAGGRVTAYDEAPLDLTVGQIIASNGPLHQPMVSLIRTARQATHDSD